MDLAKLVEKFNKHMPMQCVVVDATDAEFARVDAEMKSMGFRWACSSNAGLPEGKMRLTYLPETHFKAGSDEPRTA